MDRSDIVNMPDEDINCMENPRERRVSEASHLIKDLVDSIVKSAILANDASDPAESVQAGAGLPADTAPPAAREDIRRKYSRYWQVMPHGSGWMVRGLRSVPHMQIGAYRNRQGSRRGHTDS